MNEPIKDPKGVEMYEKILGVPEPADKPLTGLRELAVNHLFANVWSRDGLKIKERRLVTLALLAASGHSAQLRSHLVGARIGEDPLSEKEILELMVHVAHYAGWAAGASGQSAAVNVFKELAASSK